MENSKEEEPKKKAAPKGIYEGYLMKKKRSTAMNILSKTNKRYFILDMFKGTFAYYKNKKAKD